MPARHREWLAKYLRPHIAMLSHEIYGNHVLIKVLQNWSHEDKNFIYEEVIANIDEIACHKHGCCLM